MRDLKAKIASVLGITPATLDIVVVGVLVIAGVAVAVILSVIAG